MNFLGHTHVALAGGREDGGFLLGAVLPDLAPMVGVRVDRAALAGPLAEVSGRAAADLMHGDTYRSAVLGGAAE